MRYSRNGLIIAAIVVFKSGDTLQLVECNNGHPNYYSSGNDSIINWQAMRTRSYLEDCSWVNYWGYRTTPTPPPSSNDILLQSVYYQQEDDTGCYIATVAMIVANYDILCGRVPNTYATVKATNGGTTYFNWNTPEKLGLSDKDIFVTASSNISSDEKVSKIIDGLHASPYGLFANFRDSASKYSHAVEIIGYQNGNIIINDPARYGNGGERIKLTESNYLTSHYKITTGSSTATQAQMLTHLRVLTKFVPTT